MIYIRNLIYWIILIVSMPLMFIAVLFALPFDKGVNKVGRVWVKMLLWVLKNIVGLNYIVRGAENIPSTPPLSVQNTKVHGKHLRYKKFFHYKFMLPKKNYSKFPFLAGA